MIFYVIYKMCLINKNPALKKKKKIIMNKHSNKNSISKRSYNCIIRQAIQNVAVKLMGENCVFQVAKYYKVKSYVLHT